MTFSYENILEGGYIRQPHGLRSEDHAVVDC